MLVHVCTTDPIGSFYVNSAHVVRLWAGGPQYRPCTGEVEATAYLLMTDGATLHVFGCAEKVSFELARGNSRRSASVDVEPQSRFEAPAYA